MKADEAMMNDFAFEPVWTLQENIYFIPHYVEPHTWVTLGGETATTDELLKSKAFIQTKYLWKRRWVEEYIYQGRSRIMSPEDLRLILLTIDKTVRRKDMRRGKS
jgi:hypothetical protein